MNHKCEKETILYYLNKLLKCPIYGEFEDHICDWFERNSRELIGKNVEDLWESRYCSRGQEADNILPRNYRTIQKYLGNKVARLDNTAEISAMIDAFHLSPEYHDVFALWIHVTNIPLLNKLVNVPHGMPETRIMAAMLDAGGRQTCCARQAAESDAQAGTL